MPLWSCEQCGAQFPDSAAPPGCCPICEDERQFALFTGDIAMVTMDRRWLSFMYSFPNLIR